MIKSLFLLFCLFSCSMLSAAESAVMDIYTGAGTPCNGNSTYVYDFPSLQYACIMDKPGNDGVLILNGKENTLYTGVETVAFGHSGALILNLKKGNLHSILTGDYQSPWYPYSPTMMSEDSGNTVITTQDTDGYGWIYNGKVMATGLSQSSLPVMDTFGTPIVLDSTSNTSWYDRVFRGSTQILTEYSHFVYGGTFQKKSKNILILLARKGDHTVLLSLNNEGTVTKLSDVAYDIDEYPYFNINYSNPSQFAFVVKDGEKYRIVTNRGLLSGRYDNVSSLSFDPKFGFIKQVMKDGKYYFSVGNAGYGPYENLFSLNSSVNGDHWYVPVSKGGKDYMVIDGREVAF